MRRALPCIAALGLTATLHAQSHHSQPSMLDSYQRGRAVLEEAVAAHGGADALRLARKARVQTEGWEYHPTQGSRPTPPFDSTRRLVDVRVDLDARTIVWEGTRGWPGGFYYTNRFVSRGDSTFNIMPRNDEYQIVTMAAPIHQQYGNLFSITPFYLLAAMESPASARRYLGRLRLPTGDEVEAVHIQLQPQGNVTLGFDPRSHRLRAVLSVAPDVFLGDTEVITEFRDWRTLGGMLLPSEIVLHRAGSVWRRERVLAAEAGHQIPDSLVRPPGSTRLAPPSPRMNAVDTLAPGVFLVGTGSRSLVVEMDDHLVVIDAPSSGSSDVIARAPTLAPGKPIRFVVPTHHHDDHMMGVRYYAQGDATILTTAGNADYLRRMMTAPPSSMMLASNQAPPKSDYKVETIRGGTRAFTGASRRLEIHQIASPHAQEMLIAWLPQEGILFQADLIEAPRLGVALRGANAETTRHLASVIREKGWRVRTFAGAHATLQNPGEFEKLVALPIVPPGQ